MQRIDTYEFYSLGTKIHALEKVQKGAKFGNVFLILWTARGALDSIINNGVLYLNICKPACYKLRFYITEICPDDLSTIKADKFEEIINDTTVWSMHEALKEFETVFAAELRACDVYSVSQKEAYNTPDLIEQAEKIFPDVIRNTFSSQTLSDVRQAGRCLAFNLTTAAGFHITRALENVVLESSRKFSAKKSAKHDLNAYIRVLEKEDIEKEVIIELDRLREKYRNQLMHPEIFLTDIEISVLISDVKNVMIKLHWEIEKKVAAFAVAAIAAGAASSPETS